jgi:hypothetical protein
MNSSMQIFLNILIPFYGKLQTLVVKCKDKMAMLSHYTTDGKVLAFKCLVTDGLPFAGKSNDVAKAGITFKTAD